jgi:pimeloyl-ACP methyl ester carboxylesterase
MEMPMLDDQFQFRTVDVPLTSGRMRVVVEGSDHDQPVVMLHGNPTWSFFFRHLILGLRSTHRVIVPDHIGMGYSEKPDKKNYPYTLNQRILDFAELINQLEPQRPITLISHDWGGMIGMGWAVNHPQRISRIIQFNSAAFRLPASKKFPWQIGVFRIPVVGRILATRFNLFAKGAIRKCVTKPLAKTVAAQYLKPYADPTQREGIYQFVQDIPLEPDHSTYPLVTSIEQSLHQLQPIPCLICWAGRDFVFDHHFLNEWRKRMPWAIIRTFPNAGHYLPEDEPTSVLDEVLKFMGVAITEINSKASGGTQHPSVPCSSTGAGELSEYGKP